MIPGILLYKSAWSLKKVKAEGYITAKQAIYRNDHVTINSDVIDSFFCGIATVLSCGIDTSFNKAGGVGKYYTISEFNYIWTV